MNGLPYYKAYPRDFFDGTIGMSFELKAAYRLLLDLIYMTGGRLQDDGRFIAGHMGCSVRAWNRYRADLLEAGKITCEQGIISNFRADKELNTLGSFQEKQRENGAKGGKIKHLRLAVAKPNPSHTESDTYTPLTPQGGISEIWALKAESIRSGKSYLTRGISAADARGMVEAGLVSEDECRRAGVM